MKQKNTKKIETLSTSYMKDTKGQGKPILWDEPLNQSTPVCPHGVTNCALCAV